MKNLLPFRHKSDLSEKLNLIPLRNGKYPNTVQLDGGTANTKYSGGWQDYLQDHIDNQ